MLSLKPNRYVAQVVCSGLLSVLPVYASDSLSLTQRTLENGLSVYLQPDPSTPIVNVQVWYHVGSKNETPDRRGIAHLFEHMMFKGTKNIGPEEHSQLIHSVGGQDNAYTTEDVTVYYETVPSTRLHLALSLEAERMHLLDLTQATLDSEREVVKEEKRLRIDNNPILKTIERFRQLVFKVHPYAWTPAGYIEDLDLITLDDCKRFYQTYYQPRNATLIITGDIRLNETFLMVEKYFGHIPGHPLPTVKIPTEPSQRRLREEILRLPAQLPVVVMGYRIPGIRDPAIPNLEIIDRILSGGDSSRLVQRLVKRDRLAVTVGAFVEGMEDPGIYIVYAVSAPGTDMTRVRTAIIEEINQLGLKSVVAREVEAAKNQLTDRHIRSMEPVSGKGQGLGEAIVLHHNLSSFLNVTERYRMVTPGSIARTTRQYLTRNRLSVVTLLPTHRK